MSILDMKNKDIEKSLCYTCSNRFLCIFALEGIVHTCKDYKKYNTPLHADKQGRPSEVDDGS